MSSATKIEQLAGALSLLSVPERLQTVRNRLAGRLVFTTSFGLEDQALTHAILSLNLDVELVTLDTGRLFPETYDLWARTEQRYGRRIQSCFPERAAVETLIATQGIDGFRSSIGARRACCEVRKVEPLGRALRGAAGWITGLRSEQSSERARTPLAIFDRLYGLVKVNPLADWSRDDVLRYLSDNDVPYNELHDRGFLSIGCAPCTRAVAPGEPERAGRWWWELDEKKECGLHGRFPATHAGTLFSPGDASP